MCKLHNSDSFQDYKVCKRMFYIRIQMDYCGNITHVINYYKNIIKQYEYICV